MDITLSDMVKDILQAFLLLILPWIVIVLGLVFGLTNVFYYLLSITWFGSGLIFFWALH